MSKGTVVNPTSSNVQDVSLVVNVAQAMSSGMQDMTPVVSRGSQLSCTDLVTSHVSGISVAPSFLA